MAFQMPEFALAGPEIFVLIMICVILIADLFDSDKKRALAYLLTQVTLVGAFLLTITSFATSEAVTFNGSFVRDAMGDVLKMTVYLVSIGVFLYSKEYLYQRNILKGEYFVLGLFGVLGMMVMISAYSFLTLYLGLELLSLSLYAMVAFDRDNGAASEAAMKYFVLGALASGMLLYGMSMLYGASGSLEIAEVSKYLSGRTSTDMDFVLIFGLIFVIVGLAFKLGAVPFHMWIPDVYHGAPTSVTLFIGAAPKVAAFAMVMRMLVDGLSPLVSEWQDMLIIMAVLSMGIGNVVAIAQTNIKRMLAYSTISHVGFILLGVLAGTANGFSSAMFYTIIYALTTLGAFGMVILLSGKSFESDMLDDFKGLNDRSPWFAFMMLLIMFSLAGVPPTVGFYAKLSVIQAVVQVDMVWLAAVAVLFSVIGAFYYLRIVKMMYFDRIEDAQPVTTSTDMRWAMSINGVAVLALGLAPNTLMSICSMAIG